MISEKQLPELNAYRRLEGLFPVESLPQLNRLVVSGANDQLPVHRWFRFKEGFSADLVGTLLSLLDAKLSENFCLFDPYCGSGTSLLSAQELTRRARIDAVGIEQNPFIHFVAQTKTAWPLLDPEKISALGQAVLAKSRSMKAQVPGLSSLTTGRCMSRYTALRLLAIRDAIRADGRSPTHDALLLGLGSVVEQLSKTRKDGRALRLVQRGRQEIREVLSAKWAQIASDVKFMKQLLPGAATPTVLLGDGRVPSKHGIRPGSVDVVLTSPPYPNNIDYSEVYKLELWLLGFVTDSDAFLKLRKETFRSHPTSAALDLSDEFAGELRKGVLKAIVGPIISRTKASSEHYRHRLILGYASDLWTSLREFYVLLKKRGTCVVVVGNSLHGGKHLPYLIPSDLLVCAIAERSGFRVGRLAIARNFRRRLAGNHFLRESVIVLEKE
jgi:hypothetical protein